MKRKTLKKFKTLMRRRFTVYELVFLFFVDFANVGQ